MSRRGTGDTNQQANVGSTVLPFKVFSIYVLGWDSVLTFSAAQTFCADDTVACSALLQAPAGTLAAGGWLLPSRAPRNPPAPISMTAQVHLQLSKAISTYVMLACRRVCKPWTRMRVLSCLTMQS